MAERVKLEISKMVSPYTKFNGENSLANSESNILFYDPPYCVSNILGFLIFLKFSQCSGGVVFKYPYLPKLKIIKNSILKLLSIPHLFQCVLLSWLSETEPLLPWLCDR